MKKMFPTARLPGKLRELNPDLPCLLIHVVTAQLLHKIWILSLVATATAMCWFHVGQRVPTVCISHRAWGPLCLGTYLSSDGVSLQIGRVPAHRIATGLILTHIGLVEFRTLENRHPEWLLEVWLPTTNNLNLVFNRGSKVPKQWGNHKAILLLNNVMLLNCLGEVIRNWGTNNAGVL